MHVCPSTQWTACMDLKWLLLPWANQLICSVLTHRIQSLEYPNSITRAMILQKWQPLQRQKAILSKNANKDITFLLKIAERKNDFFASLFKKATFQLPFLWFFFWTSRFFFLTCCCYFLVSITTENSCLQLNKNAVTGAIKWNTLWIIARSPGCLSQAPKWTHSSPLKTKIPKSYWI